MYPATHMKLLTATLFAACALPCALSFASAQTRPAITLDEFLNASDITAARISPDGSSAVVEITAPDWQNNRFKKDLWLYTPAAGLTPLTHTGHDSSPLFSPDGRFIAFLSDRALPNSDKADDKPDKDEPARIWIIPVTGGEAFPLYREPLDTHTFAWAPNQQPDSQTIIFSTRQALSKNAEDAHKAEWKDVIQWREQERGDVLLAIPVAAAIHQAAATPEPHSDPKEDPAKPAYPKDARIVTQSPLTIDEFAISPTGDQIAFETTPVSRRLENPSQYEIFLVPTSGGEAKQLTHNEGLESQLTWQPSGKALDFLVPAAGGSIEGPYQDVQGRLYSIDLANGKTTRLGSQFKGSWSSLTIAPDGTLIATGLTGIETGLYRVAADSFTPISKLPGTFDHPVTALHGNALLYLHSEINQPTQAYLAASLSNPDKATQITQLDPIFAQRAQPTWKPFRWTAPDGTPVEGILIYPPGKQDEKNLRTFTLIHGGPADADGDRFGANWYDWATLAAANGWLVFRPNYRGSSGYGDAFELGIMPHIVSAPGKDILAGVDALVAAGIADPNHLAIGGYSYGGYMTNWLITQTTRFKAAVTGAGAVEHAANWGNDDLTRDDAWYLSGAPWEKPELYQSEAALFQLNKVTTPTHLVGGDADNRVSYLEDVLLERALQTLNIPHALLVFPGENHPLANNPWHGYIKVREELKWLEKYAAN
jgi:dipeptidyl aminopeptidase/acylaminoacyl peptidase